VNSNSFIDYIPVSQTSSEIRCLDNKRLSAVEVSKTASITHVSILRLASSRVSQGGPKTRA
jgi:hypothetical protein